MLSTLRVLARRARRFMLAFLCVFVVNALVALIVEAHGLGYDTYSHQEDFWHIGLNTLWSRLGGFWSFVALVGVILGGLGWVYGIKWLDDRPRISGWITGLISLGGALTLAFIGVRWIHLPSGAVWTVIGFLGFVALQSILVVYLSRSRRITP